jgi:hypothetical protein
MNYIILVFQLIISIVTTNSLYTVELIKFTNLESVINNGLFLHIVDLEQVINYQFYGINEEEFETLIEDLVRMNINNVETILSFYYYNELGTYCSANNCDSVQFKIENNNPIIKLKYEFSYTVKLNG